MSEVPIAIVDYGAGNLTSVIKALRYLGEDPVVTSDPEIVNRASRIVLPGVGHFAATRILGERGLTEAIRSSADRGAPFLGICVGLQWVFEGSTEAPEVAGAAFLEGQCERFQTTEKVPHVGWNSIVVSAGSRLMQGIDSGEHVYFTHSYRAPLHKSTVAVTNYGGPFTAAAEFENMMGVQFHPEKSGKAGLQILKNFLEF